MLPFSRAESLPAPGRRVVHRGFVERRTGCLRTATSRETPRAGGSPRRMGRAPSPTAPHTSKDLTAPNAPQNHRPTETPKHRPAGLPPRDCPPAQLCQGQSVTTWTLREFHQELGATLTSINGVETVAHYGDPLAEHRALTGTVGILDLSCRGRLVLLGTDRHKMLNGQVTNDILEDIVKAIDPRFLRITAKWYVRGGIYTNVVVEHRKKGWKPQPKVELPQHNAETGLLG